MERNQNLVVLETWIMGTGRCALALWHVLGGHVVVAVFCECRLHHCTSRKACNWTQRRTSNHESDHKACVQLILLFQARGGFGSPSKPAPFRVTSVPNEEVDGFDEHLQSLILGSETDSVAYIHLPKQLALEEGATEVLQWFSSTSKEQGAGDSPITDTGCAIFTKVSHLCPSCACAV
jgi:hypothetical protein